MSEWRPDAPVALVLKYTRAKQVRPIFFGPKVR